MNPLTALLLATKSPSPAPGTPDPDTVTAGWWGFAGLLFLSVAVFFLWKSMNTQLKRVRFDEVPVDPEPGDEVAPDGDIASAADVEDATAVDAADDAAPADGATAHGT